MPRGIRKAYQRQPHSTPDLERPSPHEHHRAWLGRKYYDMRGALLAYPEFRRFARVKI